MKAFVWPVVFGLGLVLSGCEIDDVLSSPGGPPIVFVGEPSHPRDFDPYYNRPKYYRVPDPYYYPPREYYHETTKKKTKGNKVFKTTEVKNQYGQTVYKNTTSHTKKKKKKK